jgi:hypothetical protein
MQGGRDTRPQYIVCEGYKPRNSVDLGSRRFLCKRKAAITAPKLMHLWSWNIAEGCERQGLVSPTGSKTAAWYQMVNLGTRETQDALPKGVCDIKPINGKILQTAFRESDQFVVPLKQGNSCGGKGLTEVRVTLGSHQTHPEVKRR